MFDYHMHTIVSSDGIGSPLEMARAALASGLSEICFTDHYDYHSDPEKPHDLFTLQEYSDAYDGLELPGLVIRRGVEMGLTRWNVEDCRALLGARPFDFVIGSVHFVDGYDPYDPQYWQGKTVTEAFRRYLDEALRLVQIHDDFDVLGHLTYVCKSVHNPSGAAVPYSDFREVADEIMRVLVEKGKGMEINTSGMDCVGAFLPSAEYLRRFRELGGEIVTVGSDAHDPSRVGQYVGEALDILREIFGYVCTFQNRQPIFHKL